MLDVGLLALILARSTMKHTGFASVALTCCWFLLPLSGLPSEASQGPRVPRVIRSNLALRFPGWRPSLPDADVTEFWKRERKLAPLDLAFVAGDFNGDGKRDWAVHVVTARAERRLIVYLRRGQGYRYRTLDLGIPDGQYYVVLEPRGTTGVDRSDDRAFVYRCDAVGLHYFEKGGYSFVYERGRFRRVITGD